MGRIFGLAALVALIALGAWIFFFLQAAGTFTTVAAKAVGVCKPVTGVVGVEDLTIDQESGLAFLSGYDRAADAAGKAAHGAIWTLDLNTPGAAPVDASASAFTGAFRPHGISLWRGADGRRVLYVINHAEGRHSIEVFDVDGAAMKHRATIRGSELVSPNDIVGMGPNQFYVTNDHGNATGWRRLAEDYLRTKETRVYFHDGDNFREVLSGIGGSNGINVSADGGTIYMSAASERRVYVYDRVPISNALVPRGHADVPGYADNIEVLPDGDLLLGLHTKVLALVAHFTDPSKRSPSHVMRLRPDGKGGLNAETIYYNDGTELSGLSVAARRGDRMLLGAIMEPKILDCTVGAK